MNAVLAEDLITRSSRLIIDRYQSGFDLMYELRSDTGELAILSTCSLDYAPSEVKRIVEILECDYLIDSDVRLSGEQLRRVYVRRSTLD